MYFGLLKKCVYIIENIVFVNKVSGRTLPCATIAQISACRFFCHNEREKDSLLQRNQERRDAATALAAAAANQTERARIVERFGFSLYFNGHFYPLLFTIKSALIPSYPPSLGDVSQSTTTTVVSFKVPGTHIKF